MTEELRNDLTEDLSLNSGPGKKNDPCILKTGIIGSTEFYIHNKADFTGRSEVMLSGYCRDEDLFTQPSSFEVLQSKSDILYFEKAITGNIQCILAALKAGKNIFIDHMDLSLEEVDELVKTATEGNHKCLVAHHQDYYSGIADMAGELKCPVLVDIVCEMAPESSQFKPVLRSRWIYQQMVALRYFFKSEIKQIAVLTANVFSVANDLISVRLDFSNNTVVNMLLTEFALKDQRHMKLVQEEKLLFLDFLEHTATLVTGKQSNEGKRGQSKKTIKRVMKYETGENTNKKIDDFIGDFKAQGNPGITILDHYIALELTGKILKRINTLQD